MEGQGVWSFRVFGFFEILTQAGGVSMKRKISLKRKCLVVATGSLLASAGAYGQSTTSSIYGQVPVEQGLSIVIHGDTGLTRSVAIDKAGRYNATQLPVGTYTVTLERNGTVLQTHDNVALRVGIGANISFAQPVAAKDMSGVTVTGNTMPPIDVSTVDSRTVLTSEQLARLPLAHSAEAAALLAPGAMSGAGGATGATGGRLVSFGGSSSTENAYYINGFNSTDPYNSAGGITLPYGSIDQEEVYTGGYSAQYGRSDGGVINMVGKSGTNDWHFGGQMLYQPEWARASQRDTYYENGLPPSPVAGSLYDPYSKNSQWSTTYDAYVGGPLIKDRLFFFASAEMTRQNSNSVSSVESGTDTYYTYHTPKWYAKINWNINDSNLLELTGASEKREKQGSIYNYDYTNLHDADFKSYDNDTKTGGDMATAKYTSYLTDSLTLTAQYGKMKTLNYSSPVGYDPDLIYVGNTTRENPAYTGGVPIINNQTVYTLPNPGKNFKTSNLRLSLTYTIGSHTITGGIDNLRSTANEQNSVTSGPGGYYWSYGYTTHPELPLAQKLGVGALDGYPNGSSGYYATKQVSISGANLLTVQHAEYLEDQWQVSDRWLLSLGIRNDAFTNYNGSGDSYMSQTKPQWAPRLGFSWDVYGDSSFKVYGNVGRYYLGLPLAPGGAANGYTSTTQYYTYSGIAADGTPTGLTQMSGPVSANNAFGQSPDPRTVTAHNIKAQDEDEYILGFTKTAGPSWVYGAKFTRRVLRHLLDDYCDADRVVQKAASLGIDDVNDATCYYINPGIANTFAVADANGDYHNVTLSNAEMGNPQAKRKYYALESFLEHPFDGHWYGKIDYVFSRLYGNSEGQGQSDIRATGGIQNEDWDFPELMYYANGPQGNDSTHQIKAFGYYQFTPEWLVSANLSLLSGGPKYCLGLYGADPYDTSTNDPAGYGSNYHWCNGEPSPPGKNGRLPWQKQLDLGVQYRPNFAAHRLAFSLDVFNVTNSQVATNLYSQLYSNSTGAPNYTYGTPAVLQPPRYVRFGVTYDY
jgi:outer membrane receptor protein involved in Fe transport